ncbi:MAG: hypothetical protein JSS11_06405 [Verrucomicrobia bacterium]|nr:hypothetical protein [Verrucomicrobiota bacterium]
MPDISAEIPKVARFNGSDGAKPGRVAAVRRSWWRAVGIMTVIVSGAASAAAAAPAKPQAPVVQFGYYPSFNFCVLQIDLSGRPDRTQVKQAPLVIRQEGGATPIAEKQLSVTADKPTNVEWPLPVLSEGVYECSVRLEGGDVPEQTFRFERRFFPWEHNQLGRSDIVVPPFTPLHVERRRVSTILREHDLTSLGLWLQVTSLGAGLLTRPMRLEIVQDGKSREITTRNFRITTKTPTRVVTEAKFKEGRAEGEWSYDGVLRWTLELTPATRPIQALTLIIPIDERQAPLMHACTDGIRINYAGAVPAGTGRIWDGSKADRRTLGGTYVPYIWLGGEERGLAVFGENERGWVTAKGVSCQELRRGPGGLELRLNLIASPVTIDAPRRIVLGFQATPTKPMPANWRLTTLDYPEVMREGGENLRFLGSGWSWGALTPCADVYPWGEDFGLWDEFVRARKAGRIDPAYMEKWLERVPAGPRREQAARETGYGYRKVAESGTDPVVVYTNPRGVRFDTPEGRTFLNEWCRFAYPKREWPEGGAVWYDANLAESFQDYCVWYYRRMLGTFVEGIYWDDTFLQSTYIPAGTDAFRLPDGQIRPAVGLWAMRELIRRTAVLDQEMHRPARNMLHTTNAAVAPVLAYGQMLLTWEDQKGDRDFQDRHTREYLRAESIGRQHGMVPFGMVLTDTSDPAKVEWINRTVAGVALVHEVKFIGGPKVWRDAYRMLVNFGYGRSGVAVHNYWQQGNPVAVEGTDASTLCLSKPGEVLVVVCDYGQGGELALKLDARALGLGGDITAANAETGAALPVDPDGRVKFRLARHDFCLIAVKNAAASVSEEVPAK